MGNSSQKQKFQEVFKTIDENGDGKLSSDELVTFFFRDEVKEIHSSLKHEEKGKLQKEIEAIGKHDKDKDHKLSFDEFYAAIEANDNIKNLLDKVDLSKMKLVQKRKR